MRGALLSGAKIWQGPERGWACAVAIRDGRFLAIGTDAEARAALGAGTFGHEDLAGGYLIPGIFDAHMHPLFGAVFQDAGLALRDGGGGFLRDAAAVAEAVRAAAASGAQPGEEWLVGYGWDPALTANPAFDRHLLDRAAPGRAVYLLSLDAHFALVSTPGLERLGMIAFPPDSGSIPAGGDGRPVGLLLETPQFIASLRVLAQMPHERKAEAFLAFQAQALAAGVTGVTEIVADHAALGFYLRLHQEGRLRLRLQVSPYGPLCQLGAERDTMLAMLAAAPDAAGWVGLGPVKFLLDGTPGNHNAAWFQPYADAASTAGMLTIAPDALAAEVAKAVAVGYDLALHAAGDLSVHVALDAIAAAGPRIQRQDDANAQWRRVRLRIEHFDNCTAGDLARLPRLAERGLVASVQPTHFHPVYVAAIERVLGPERMRREYPLASLRRAGIPLALNSDWPAAMSFAPMDNLRAAVDHGSESLDPGEALMALTWGNAYAARREHELGTMARGYRADSVLLDGDPLGPRTPRVMATMIDGNWVAGSLRSLRAQAPI